MAGLIKIQKGHQALVYGYRCSSCEETFELGIADTTDYCPACGDEFESDYDETEQIEP